MTILQALAVLDKFEYGDISGMDVVKRYPSYDEYKYAMLTLESEIADLKGDSTFLQALMDAGVDNWEGYEHAQEAYQEAND